MHSPLLQIALSHPSMPFVFRPYFCQLRFLFGRFCLHCPQLRFGLLDVADMWLTCR
jgi:hypothetical protein